MNIYKIYGYGFLRPGLKTGVENGSFGLKLDLDLEKQAAPRGWRHTPPKTVQGVPSPLPGTGVSE